MTTTLVLGTHMRRQKENKENKKSVEINHSTIDKRHTTFRWTYHENNGRDGRREGESIQKVEIGHVDTARDMPSRLIHQSRAALPLPKLTISQELNKKIIKARDSTRLRDKALVMHATKSKKKKMFSTNYTRK